MAEYRRFVAYVYEYQKEKKGSNCGFVKIEVRGEICRIELHLQCPGLMPESTCSVYGFVRNRGLLDGILLGGCVTGDGKVECILEISAGNMGDSGKSLDEMGGMIFVTEQGGFFGTEWDDQMIRPGNFRVVEKRMIPETQPDLSETERSSEEEIAEYIRTCGLFKTKARDIFAMCKKLKEEFNGVVPDNMEDLLSLPGVGRKTANLILGDVYGKPAVVTDTHFIRICGKLGLTNNKVPVKVEEDLRKLLPPEESSDFCHRIVLHGRAVCDARKPKCDICCMKSFCKYAQSISK